MKVTLMIALTADGKIAKDASHYPDWTGSADKKLFKQITLDAGVIIMGSATYATIGKPLPNRRNIVLSRRTDRVSSYHNLEYTNNQPAEIIAKLESDGFDRAILIGGAQINTLFAKAGLINEMILTYCPNVFGSGLSLFSESLSMDLELLAAKQLDTNVFYAHYRVKNL
jgi:dihydrofolate reductase